ncbi:hypothetical protein HDZ31DRAFT_43884 [Schizophyllum fasciatum]
MTGTILLTGGNGKTSSRVAQQLSDAGVPFLMTSRAPPAAPRFPTARFDWLDDATWDTPFEAAGGAPVAAVYLVAPPVLDALTPMARFVERARARGVRRFVLLSASPLPRGAPGTGAVHEYLANAGVEYCVLRPTWFMENFSEQQHRKTICEEGRVYSATGDGKVPFVSCDDIAAVAVRALTDERSHDTDHLILGPELLTYDDVARILGDALGREITHVKLSQADMEKKFIEMGVPEDYAPILAGMDVAISKGSEERLSDAVERVTGRPPKSFRTFAQEIKGAWLGADEL